MASLVFLSLLGSAVSLFEITQVSRGLDSINRGSVPLGRLLTQLRSDSDVLRREMEKGLGYSTWKRSGSKQRQTPDWILSLMESEFTQGTKLPVSKDWKDWFSTSLNRLKSLRQMSQELAAAMNKEDDIAVARVYPGWVFLLDDLVRDTERAARRQEKELRQAFSSAESSVSELRTGMKLVLAAVVFLSLLLLWIGERALRPLTEITELARNIASGGLRADHKALLPDLPIRKGDEVGTLTREFRRMAIGLLERERTIETQNQSLLEHERKLRIAEHLAAVGRMSAQVAHEVRNPLHSIGLEAEMALELTDRNTDPNLKHSLQSILASVDRLQKITENYLRLSRTSSGETTVFDLREALEEVLATYAPSFEANSIRVDWSVEAGVSPSVCGDKGLLEQAIGNILRNSIQALEEIPAPSVAIRMGQLESGRVWLRIQDNGPGISPDVKEKLFTPFLTTKAQGTGLGLSFAREVLKGMGGEIRLLEEKTGACFELLMRIATQVTVERRADGQDLIGG